MQAEKNAKLYEKQRAQELKAMEERDKQYREEVKQQRELNSKFPERQFNMLLSGKAPKYQFGNMQYQCILHLQVFPPNSINAKDMVSK
jgi:hypothetical protein